VGDESLDNSLICCFMISLPGGLDEMTSAKDFRLFSWKNGLILSGIVVAVLIPVGIRWYLRDRIAAVADVEEELEEDIDVDENVTLSSSNRRVPLGGVLLEARAARSPSTRASRGDVRVGGLILLDDDLEGDGGVILGSAGSSSSDESVGESNSARRRYDVSDLGGGGHTVDMSYFGFEREEDELPTSDHQRD
jgi:hypothetical protein